ncbi:hypothetical protein BH11MYX3_BH11MYX3_28410 [soil metagenome]
MLRFALAVAMVGCAVSPRPPGPAAAPGAQEPAQLVQTFGVPGEAMEFAATLRGLAVGRVVTAVGKPGWVDGQRALIVKSRGQSTGMIALLAELVWEQTTTINLDRGHIIDSKEETWTVLAGEHEHETRSLDGAEDVHDIHSATAAVRAWRSLPGQTALLDINFGHHTVHAELRDAGHGFLVSAGEPAVRYEGTFEDEVRFSAWVSDDTARVPLRFECELDRFGRIVVELVHYTAPVDGS